MQLGRAAVKGVSRIALARALPGQPPQPDEVTQQQTHGLVWVDTALSVLEGSCESRASRC